MIEREKMLELAVRCETATGPGRALRTIEQDIHDAIFGRTYLENPHQTDGSRILKYCRSLDAAMTLLPKGALWEVEHKINTGLGETFERPEHEPEMDFRAGVGMGDVPARWTHGRSFATPALALTAAALRALASKEEADGR